MTPEQFAMRDFPPHPDEKLWCVHIEGPDDLVAAPSKELAEEAAKHMNAHFSQNFVDPILRAVVIEWIHSPESHASCLPKFYEQTGLKSRRSI
jgi:hypothetical protein